MFDTSRGLVARLDGALPDLATLGRVHGRTSRALEGISEGREVDSGTIDAELGGRVRVGQEAVADSGRSELRAPGLSESDEEELLIGESRDDGGLSGLVGVREHVGGVRSLQTTSISNVLALSEVSVDEESRERRELGILVDDAVNTLLELLGGLGSPPVLELALTVEVTSLGVERVSQFVSSDHTDTSIVHGSGVSGVEEGSLKNTGREAFSVGGG